MTLALEGAVVNLAGHFGIAPTAYSPLTEDVLLIHFFNLMYLQI